MDQEFDSIVLGLGGFGSAAAYWLARNRRRVLGLEQFEVGHLFGGSQDHSRIIRLSYHTPQYVELARLAYLAWADLERDAGESLILKTGGLDLVPYGGAIPLEDYLVSLDSAQVPYEILDATEIMNRFPAFRVAADVRGLFQADAGIVPAARCNAAHRRLATEYGATLMDNSPVESVRSEGDQVIVETGGDRYIGENLIIAAGAWTNRVLSHFDLQLPLTVTQEQVTYFVPMDPEPFAPGRFPVWVWLDEPCFYGFPMYGEPAAKVGQDVGGEVVTADTRTFDPNPEALDRVNRFLGECLPDLPGEELYTRTCLYTLTPDRDFILDRLPDHPNVFVAVGAGHGFKFASLIGKILSELAIHGRTELDIYAFRADRPVLLEKDPENRFMI